MAVYFYQNMNLKDYCLKHHLDYHKIYRNLLNLRKTAKEKDFTLEEQIEITIKKYQQKSKIRKIKRSLFLLDQVNDSHSYYLICSDLNISYEQVRRYYYRGYNRKQMILYIWFFGDQENIQNKRIISHKRFQKVINYKFHCDELNIYYMIAYYKCGDSKYLENIFIYIQKLSFSIINKLLRKYNYHFDQEKKNELLSEANFIFMKTINTIVLNNLEQVMKYLNIVLIKRLNDYLFKNFQYNPELKEEMLYSY